jgi:hypothetical protein
VPHVVRFSAIDSHTTELTVHEYGYPNAETVEISKADMEHSLDKMASSVATT